MSERLIGSKLRYREITVANYCQRKMVGSRCEQLKIDRSGKLSDSRLQQADEVDDEFIITS